MNKPGQDLYALSPLKGVRVLSLAQQLPGPFAGRLLADLGADVILVEQREGGDPARRIWPFFESVNHGKRSIALDLKSNAGNEILRRLARTSRVVLEGFRPGVAGRLGVDFETLLAERPDIIYCSISGYGQDSAEQLVPGHDVSYQARGAGIAPEGFQAGGSTYAVADLSAAMYAALAVTSALLCESAVYFDLSLTDSALSWKAPQLAVEWANSKGTGSAHNPAYGIFRTRDGWISLSVMHEDHFWRALCEQLDMVEYCELPAAARRERAVELRDRLNSVIERATSESLITRLGPAGVPIGIVQTAETVVNDSLFRQRGMIVGMGSMSRVRTPISRTAPVDEPLAPALGADTCDLLTECGYTAADIDELVESEVVWQN